MIPDFLLTLPLFLSLFLSPPLSLFVLLAPSLWRRFSKGEFIAVKVACGGLDSTVSRCNFRGRRWKE